MKMHYLSKRAQLIGAAFLLCSSTAPALAADNAELNASRAAASELLKVLKGEMEKALQSGGPINAIHFCNENAQKLTQEVATKHGVEVSRTSLRIRNPKNQPDAWETAVLKAFDERRVAGEAAKDLEHYEVVDANGTQTFRYMKAIPLFGPCYNCHGAVKPQLKSEITRLYPNDQAIGFKVGDVRGAFTVQIPMK
jgi:hypothetical protein